MPAMHGSSQIIMEALGAVAPIISTAVAGASFSPALYNGSGNVGSASKDARRIAKDLALFSPVLKDLGKALERGSEIGGISG